MDDVLVKFNQQAKRKAAHAEYRRVTGPWGTQEVLMMLCAAHARRIVFPNVRMGRAIWGVTDDNDAWYTAYDNDMSLTRHFFRMDGQVHCVMDLENNTLNTLQPKVQVSGTSVRDVLRKQMRESGFQLSVSLFQHHIESSDDIVNSWVDSDFEFYLTVDRDHYGACPYFDWDYIDDCIQSFNRVQNEEAIRQLEEDDGEANVLNFPGLL